MARSEASAGAFGSQDSLLEAVTALRQENERLRLQLRQERSERTQQIKKVRRHERSKEKIRRMGNRDELKMREQQTEDLERAREQTRILEEKLVTVEDRLESNMEELLCQICLEMVRRATHFLKIIVSFFSHAVIPNAPQPLYDYVYLCFAEQEHAPGALRARFVTTCIHLHTTCIASTRQAIAQLIARIFAH
jgi:Fe2+ transport system protein B